MVPTPKVNMGAGLSKIFNGCPLKINCATSWINPDTNDQHILFGCDQGFLSLYFGLFQLVFRSLLSESEASSRRGNGSTTPTKSFMDAHNRKYFDHFDGEQKPAALFARASWSHSTKKYNQTNSRTVHPQKVSAALRALTDLSVC